MPAARRRRNRLAMRLASIMTLTALWAASACNSASAADSSGAAIGEHIQHIRGALLPAVVISGKREPATTLADRMASLHVPGVSIAVIHDGRLEWARGFGVSRIGGPAVTPNTLFQAASISKPVTAMGVLHWVQMGKLDLDADVNQTLKRWKMPSGALAEQKPVTARELLTRTAGLTVHGFEGYASGAPLPNLEQILDGLPPANSPAIRVDTVPGTIWRYSGDGYVVLQQMMEDLTGQHFAKLMQETVLDPIGMTHSTFTQPLPEGRLAELAAPYGTDGKPIKGGPHVYPEMAPAGLWTTPSDLARFAIEIQRSLRGNSNRVLSVSTTRMMLTGGLNNRGLGVNLGGQKNHPFFEHGGANAGYRCELTVYNAGDGAIIMTNADGGGQLTEELRRTIAHEYAWPDFQPKVHRLIHVDPGQYGLLTGTYQLQPDAFLTISREGNRLFSQATGRRQTEIFPESAHDYFATAIDARITFDLDAQGRASSLVLHQDGQDRTANRIDDAAAKPIAEALAAINKRVHDQTPAIGSEAALRQFIIEISAGTPNYDKLGAELASVTRDQLASIQTLLNRLGAVQSIALKEVTPDGYDVYTVRFANGSAECGLALQAGGIIAGAFISKIEE